MSSVDSGTSDFVMSKGDGTFEYPLNDRKIVHNQEIEVTSSSMDGLYDEEDEEVEESSTEKLVLRKKVQKLKLHILLLDMKMPIKCLKSN